VGDKTYDYLTLVNWAVLQLRYSGQLERLRQKWWTPPNHNTCSPTS
jgi:hypothetical protein